MGDEELRREVESLLVHKEQAEGFIETSSWEMAAKEMAEETGRVLVGKQIGAYRITSLLGAGGMGEVYRAEDTRLGRTVAVKVLPEELAQDRDRMQRFVREARATSAFNHANVAHIYEIGESDGLHFIAMEYVEGQSLAQKMSGQPLELREVAGYRNSSSRCLGGSPPKRDHPSRHQIGQPDDFAEGASEGPGLWFGQDHQAGR